MNKQQIKEFATQLNGKARNRTLNQKDIDTFSDLVEAHRNDTTVTTIRVFSSQGFVPSAYKWRAEIAALTATRNPETGEFNITGRWHDAHRSYGNGALITINNRAIQMTPVSEVEK